MLSILRSHSCNSHSGKSSLISRIEKKEPVGKDAALEYHYLTIQADYRDASYAYQLGGAGLGPSDSVNLPLWIMDGDESFAPLLKFALSPSLNRSVIMLCASLSEPTEILPSLNRWSRVIREAIKAQYDDAVRKEASDMQVRFWQEYVEPLESSMHTDKHGGIDVDSMLVPLEDGILSDNLGASVIVVLTKSDAQADMIEENIDRIQYHVRKFCLRHGAALVYTSAKDEKNTQLLNKYIAHRACGLPFISPAQLVEKDSIFIPAGWDSDKKLDIIRETLENPDTPLTAAEIPRPSRDNVVADIDEQDFLVALSNSAETVTNSPKRSSHKGVEGQPTDGNSPLVSFFNNLLKSKEKEGSEGKSPRQSLGGDAHAHFQKILEQKSSGGQPPVEEPADSHTVSEAGDSMPIVENDSEA
uniref:Dynein light intermediate chain n=1 Tax=Steinernema glaseri TaxID=37863 RepID=A0A1I7YSG1_9BILA